MGKGRWTVAVVLAGTSTSRWKNSFSMRQVLMILLCCSFIQHGQVVPDRHLIRHTVPGAQGIPAARHARAKDFADIGA